MDGGDGEIVLEPVLATDDRDAEDVALVESSSRMSRRSWLDAVGRPYMMRTLPTPPSPTSSMQLRTNCLYVCGWSNRRTTDQTAAMGTVMCCCTTAEQHRPGPNAACSW